jgi:hypothetical protein
MASLVDRSIRCAKCFVLAVLGVGYVSTASAQWSEVTDWGRIERFSTENEDAMAVYHSAPFKNPGEFGNVSFGESVRPKCKIEDKGYATDPSDPGHKLHHAAIIGAYLHQKQVRLRLAGCVFDRPRLISVEVKD